MPQCLIAFGANEGDTRAALKTAIAKLSDHPQIRVLRTAEPVETPAVVGDAADRNQSQKNIYLNSAILVETSLPAESLFAETSRVELAMGRQRSKRWADRSIDLDVILYDDEIVSAHDLEVPHPRMSFRKFVLQTAIEIAAEMIDPISGQTVSQLWQRLNQAPPKILWVTEDPTWAQSVSEEITAALTKSATLRHWRIDLQSAGVNLNDLDCRQYRLLAADGSVETFRPLAKQFAGPWLYLRQPQHQQAVVRQELVAAMEAMIA